MIGAAPRQEAPGANPGGWSAAPPVSASPAAALQPTRGLAWQAARPTRRFFRIFFPRARLALIALPLTVLLIHADPARANLSDLSVFVTADGTELPLVPSGLPAYHGSQQTYTFEVIAFMDTPMVTVRATAATVDNRTVTVQFGGTDADPDTEGFQVALSPGRNTITVRDGTSEPD